MESTATQYVGVTEGVKLTGINDSSLKRYLLNHSQFMDYKKVGRMYRISMESLELIKVIRDYYSKGLLRDQIDQILENEGLPVTVTLENDETLPVSLNERLINMDEMLKQHLINNDKLIKEIDSLNNKVDKLTEVNEDLSNEVTSLKSDIEARDKELLKTMKESMQETKDALTEANKQANKSWISKLFSSGNQ